MAKTAKRWRGRVASSRSNSRRLRNPVSGSDAATSARWTTVSSRVSSVRRRSRKWPIWRPMSPIASTTPGSTASRPGAKKSMTPITRSSLRMGKPMAPASPAGRATPGSSTPGSPVRSATITGAAADQTRSGSPGLSWRSSRRAGASSPGSKSGSHQVARRVMVCPWVPTSTQTSPPHMPRLRPTSSSNRVAATSKLAAPLSTRGTADWMTARVAARRRAEMSRTRSSWRRWSPLGDQIAISTANRRPSLVSSSVSKRSSPDPAPSRPASRAARCSRSSGGASTSREGSASSSPRLYAVIAVRAGLTSTMRPRRSDAAPSPRTLTARSRSAAGRRRKLQRIGPLTPCYSPSHRS